MAVVGLVGSVLYVLVVFVGQPLLLRRRTGSSAWVRSWGSTRAEKLANVLFVLGCLSEVANPALVLTGVLRPAELGGGPVRAAVAVAAMIASFALAVLAQQVMAGSWRTGVDPDRPSPLVTAGPFQLIRHPTYTSLLTQSLAVLLLVPTGLAVAAVFVCLVGLQVQTRLVEEPYLRRLHGRAYQRYGARSGRFLPGIGRFHAENGSVDGNK